MFDTDKLLELLVAGIAEGKTDLFAGLLRAEYLVNDVHPVTSGGNAVLEFRRKSDREGVPFSRGHAGQRARCLRDGLVGRDELTPRVDGVFRTEERGSPLTGRLVLRDRIIQLRNQLALECRQVGSKWLVAGTLRNADTTIEIALDLIPELQCRAGDRAVRVLAQRQPAINFRERIADWLEAFDGCPVCAASCCLPCGLLHGRSLHQLLKAFVPHRLCGGRAIGFVVGWAIGRLCSGANAILQGQVIRCPTHDTIDEGLRAFAL